MHNRSNGISVENMHQHVEQMLHKYQYNIIHLHWNDQELIFSD